MNIYYIKYLLCYDYSPCCDWDSNNVEDTHIINLTASLLWSELEALSLTSNVGIPCSYGSRWDSWGNALLDGIKEVNTFPLAFSLFSVALGSCDSTHGPS